jgi:hypothetical protein
MDPLSAPLNSNEYSAFIKGDKFGTIGKTIRFSSKSLLHGVCQL